MQLQEAFKIFLDYCEHEKKLSRHTLRAYRSDLLHFGSTVGNDKKVNHLSAVLIEKTAQNWLRNPELKTATVKRRVACVKSLVRWLFRRRVLTANPLESLDLQIKLPKRLPRNLQTTEIKRLMQALPPPSSISCGQSEIPNTQRRYWDHLTARLAIEVMTLTGVRVGELVRIRRHQIDPALQQIRILGKGNRERQVSFPDTVTNERLEKYRAEILLRFGTPETDALFVNSLGRPVNEQYIRRIVRRYAETIALGRRVTPHMLRHTAATQLLEAGVDIRFVQRILGHASITTTEIYTHVADQALRLEVCRANVRRRLETH
jgi:integrase/recombinase XerD